MASCRSCVSLIFGNDFCKNYLFRDMLEAKKQLPSETNRWLMDISLKVSCALLGFVFFYAALGALIHGQNIPPMAANITYACLAISVVSLIMSLVFRCLYFKELDKENSIPKTEVVDQVKS